MGRVNTPILTSEERKALEKGYQTGKSHAFRKRCQLILLKSESRDSASVATILKMHAMSVNTWVKRYKNEGIDGLNTKAGRGRKALLTKSVDESAVLAAVKANRQRVDMAKAEWEAAQSTKTVSRDTFRRFLKALAGNTSESAADARKNQTPNSTNSK